MNLLNKIFDRDKVCIQRFGDKNQTISMNYSEEEIWVFNKNIKVINTSKRYGNKMAKFLEPLRVAKVGHMSGNQEINTLNPHIIVFNDSTIESVLPQYFKLLEKYNINEDESKKIKIIGKIGKKVRGEGKTIASYIKDYKAKNNKDMSFSEKMLDKMKNTTTPRELFNQIFSILILCLTINDKYVSLDELVIFMEKNYINELFNYKMKILRWFIEIKKNTEETLEDIILKTETIFSNIEEIDYKSDSFKEKIQDSTVILREQSSKLIVEKNSFNMQNINTIMGTKGETHKATLYLESKLIYNDWKDLSDISRILDYMVGKKKEVDKSDEEALMNAYVAMSRAEKLTCIAIQYETIKGHLQEFFDFGYKIVGCNDEIQNLIEKSLK